MEITWSDGLALNHIQVGSASCHHELPSWVASLMTVLVNAIFFGFSNNNNNGTIVDEVEIVDHLKLT